VVGMGWGARPQVVTVRAGIKLAWYQAPANHTGKNEHFFMTELELKQIAAELADAGADILVHNYKCPQNPSNDPHIAPRYLERLRAIVVAYDEKMRENR
jgi:hypothetical protein